MGSFFEKISDLAPSCYQKMRDWLGFIQILKPYVVKKLTKLSSKSRVLKIMSISFLLTKNENHQSASMFWLIAPRSIDQIEQTFFSSESRDSGLFKNALSFDF